MDAKDVIRAGLNMANVLTQSYLGDLSDADLLVRPVPGANHISWQLGHLLASENEMVEAVCPGSMPPLPDGFADKFTSDTSKLDSPGAFYPKSVYLEVLEQQRSATLAALDKLSNADLDKPSPEKYQRMWKTVGEVFDLQGTHWTMHAGQWAIVRRKLGHKPVI
jgi:hypothetical protein